eukprot:CAMPEP_0180345294 /NCGR_PEP_ID=MMETSP0989-20121125/3248_1 /TAXON_ID=697907 /ORGANISM="non described non described, Strain CCMP2293" /LENGTH=212 /DNA_ID=CAMNT_0022334319 /DNA_START=27 /DNA_END=661 /DNA_ORIENTATION=+
MNLAEMQRNASGSAAGWGVDAATAQRSAEVRFRALDAQDHGYLTYEQVCELSNWVWGSFYSASAPLSSLEREQLAARIIRHGGNRDNEIVMLKPFLAWYATVREQVHQHHTEGQPSASAQIVPQQNGAARSPEEIVRDRQTVIGSGVEMGISPGSLQASRLHLHSPEPAAGGAHASPPRRTGSQDRDPRSYPMSPTEDGGGLFSPGPFTDIP